MRNIKMLFTRERSNVTFEFQDGYLQITVRTIEQEDSSLVLKEVSPDNVKKWTLNGEALTNTGNIGVTDYYSRLEHTLVTEEVSDNLVEATRITLLQSGYLLFSMVVWSNWFDY